jgi:hypothetical protein
MSNQINFKKVLERVQEAEQLIRIGIEKGSLSTIERDILLEKLRASYEILLFDRKDNLESPSVVQDFSKNIQKIKVEPSKEVELPKVEPEVKTITSSSKQTSHKPDQEIEPKQNESAVEEEDIFTEEVDELPKIEHEIYVNGSQEKIKPPVLGDKFQGTKKFRNEALGAGKKDMASKLQNKPIHDLTKAIGINDKFLYTKELFNGNAELYAKTIQKLNEFSDINDALIFIQENFSWDDKNEAANQLMELVRRKLLFS